MLMLNTKFLSCQHRLGTLLVNEPVPLLLWLLPWLFSLNFHDIPFLLFFLLLQFFPILLYSRFYILVYTTITTLSPTTTSCSSAFYFTSLPSFLSLIFFPFIMKIVVGIHDYALKRYIILLHVCKQSRKKRLCFSITKYTCKRSKISI